MGVYLVALSLLHILDRLRPICVYAREEGGARLSPDTPIPQTPNMEEVFESRTSVVSVKPDEPVLKRVS